MKNYKKMMDFVNFDGVVTSKYGGWDPTQAIDDDLDKIFSLGVSQVDLLTLSRSRISILRRYQRVGGRFGLQRAPKGLVDEIGGIENAITYAANSAVEDYKVDSYGEELSPESIRELIDNFDVGVGNFEQ